MEYQVRARLPEDLDAFTRGYLECAEWCGIDEEQRGRFGVALAPVWTPESIEEAKADCRDFQEANAKLLEVYYGFRDDLGAAGAGHDFWLTRNGHGAGFWDRGLGTAGVELSEAAKVYGSAYVWYDDDEEVLVLS